MKEVNFAGCSHDRHVYCFAQEGGIIKIIIIVIIPNNTVTIPFSYCFCGGILILQTVAYMISVPPRPENVAVARLDSTTIVVSWEKLSLVEMKGLATYVVTYSVVIPSRKRQQFRGTVNVSWTEDRVFISNLHPGAQYDITVGILTSAGMSGRL